MPESTPAAVLDLFTPEERRKIALREVDSIVQSSIGQSVSSIRSKVSTGLQDLDPNAASEYSAALSSASSGHDSVKVENLGPGTMGINYEVGSHKTAVDASMLSTEVVLGDSTQLKEVLEHEDSESFGHAGQVYVGALVNADGSVVDSTTVLEGNVEDHMTSRHGQRGNQPKEVYGEGEDFVKQVGATTIDAYARGKADRAKTQAKIFERGNLDSQAQVEAMQKAGFTSPEMREVYLATRNSFENGPEITEEDLAMAA